MRSPTPTSKTLPLGFGIVGCGESCAAVCSALSLIEGAQIRGFCDVSRVRAQARAEQFGGTVYSRVQDLAHDPSVQVVSICTPYGLHMEAAVTAAAAGKHVLVDEPLEVTLERLDQLVQACRERRVKLGAMLPRRFLPSSRAVKQAIEAGRFGRVVRASVFMKWAGSQAPYSASSWLEGGGVLMNQGFHGVDLLQWLMGPVSKVSAFPNRRRSGRVDEVLAMTVQFRSGAVGTVESTKSAWPGEDLRLEVRGNRGAAILRNDRIAYWEFEDGHAQEPLVVPSLAEGFRLSNDAKPPPTTDILEGQRRQLEDFVSAIKENRRPGVEGSEARPVVALIQAAYRSAREGRVVDVDEN